MFPLTKCDPLEFVPLTFIDFTHKISPNEKHSLKLQFWEERLIISSLGSKLINLINHI